MTRAEIHAQDVSDSILQAVQAGGRVNVCEPDPDTVGRWRTVAIFPTMPLAEAFIAGAHFERSERLTA